MVYFNLSVPKFALAFCNQLYAGGGGFGRHHKINLS
jgi:hypothetical protein